MGTKNGWGLAKETRKRELRPGKQVAANGVYNSYKEAVTVYYFWIKNLIMRKIVCQ